MVREKIKKLQQCLYLSLVAIAVLFYQGSALGLEYLSDEELTEMDGYTSPTLEKKYTQEGEVSFNRRDNYKCRYGQNPDNDDDARFHCEKPFETENDRLLAASFEDYLQRALALMNPHAGFDDPEDGIQEIDIEVYLDDFDYTHMMCDSMPNKGAIRFEGIAIRTLDDKPVRIHAVTQLKTEVINGREKVFIESVTDPIDGYIGVEAIRIAKNPSSFEGVPSLGGVYIFPNVSAKMRISLNED